MYKSDDIRLKGLMNRQVVMLEELVEGYVSSLYTHKLFHPDDQEG